MKSRARPGARAALVLWLAALGAGLPVAQAAPPPPPEVRGVSTAAAGPFQIALYKSAVLSFPRAIQQVSVGNPGVADILILRRQQLYVVGKNLGTTNVVAWDDSCSVLSTFDVEVTHDLDTIKQKLHGLL
ncbi:MAG: pilus assembly protein N-terminal domain-containing protein, partial [Gammaproteobacteria bacterium]